ncbi:unnamed protein product [Periconia digitata]|uniref:Protein kinase domain-containing protein n=1 Tax=Periconia digitata TaxID=1303443 RepID=A0A9W4XPM6_9PLEO|nr:unnamed protein product [Periconia digitata]
MSFGRSAFSDNLLKRKRGTPPKEIDLDEAIDEVETWQRLTFDPLWFETVKAQAKQFDAILQETAKDKLTSTAISVRNPLRNLASSNVFLPAHQLESAEKARAAYSTVELIKVDDKWRLRDSTRNLHKNFVRELAVKLNSANPATFGLLTCLGAAQHQPSLAFSIIFRMPDNMAAPETLRAKLPSTTPSHSLSDRFRLAIQLARAVFHFHTFDMVHKSIRPENILLFRDSESTLGSAFLLGFERVRRDEDDTRLSGDEDWARNLCRHPQRQGPRLQERYIMPHDIYSLGVCLLEIGLWSSFVDYTPSRTPI